MLVSPILMWLFLFLTYFLFCKMAKKKKIPWVNICFQLCLCVCVCAHACVYVCMHVCVLLCAGLCVCVHLCMCVLIITPESNGSREVVIWINNKFLILVSYSDPQREMCLWIKLLSMLLIDKLRLRTESFTYIYFLRSGGSNVSVNAYSLVVSEEDGHFI